ncbi:H-NS family nucleoid-associated regulatory protein [Paraburkholderia sp. IW21]|uniref:H-NS family nucleoid-associated regulatory protein n=1 Tax=Paraburkholderia sp. IW21 TaxID=3242488 RepID=UPI003520994D
MSPKSHDKSQLRGGYPFQLTASDSEPLGVSFPVGLSVGLTLSQKTTPLSTRCLLDGIVRPLLPKGKTMATLEKVQAQIMKLQAQAEALVAKQSGAVLAKIRDLMEKHNLTIADIDTHAGGKKRGPKPGAKAALAKTAQTAKYRDPKSGAAGTGHGRAPVWIANAKDRSKFLAVTSFAASVPVGKSSAKAGNYVRGAQPALYADPKSGATWSGRGRAPAWLAEAKDRSKLLIAGGAEETVAATAGAVSKAKAEAKKTSKSVGATAGSGQRKGPLPAMYLDPKSGATWSGRGPAPAWLAGAKDRTKFLIDGDNTAVDAKAAVRKAVAKKAPTAKKTVAKKGVSAKALAKKAAMKKAAPAVVHKAPAKKAPLKSVVAGTAPVTTVEPGAESTT